MRCDKLLLSSSYLVCDLLQASRHVGDLFEDLRDGHNLISLLEVLSGEHLVSTLYFFKFSVFSWNEKIFVKGSVMKTIHLLLVIY